MWEQTHNVSIHGGIAEVERHTPLVLSGGGVKPGVYKEIAEGIDLAPTATALLGGSYLKSYQGRILSEALRWEAPFSAVELRPSSVKPGRVALGRFCPWRHYRDPPCYETRS